MDPQILESQLCRPNLRSSVVSSSLFNFIQSSRWFQSCSTEGAGWSRDARAGHCPPSAPHRGRLRPLHQFRAALPARAAVRASAAGAGVGERRTPGQPRGGPARNWGLGRSSGSCPPGLGPSAGAVSSSPPKLELGVGAVRAVKGPEHLKEQCTWGSKACGRARLLSPGWDRLGAQSLLPVAPGPGPALRGLEGRQRSSRLREELDRRSGPGARVIS